jgi:hypothetical protein
MGKQSRKLGKMFTQILNRRYKVVHARCLRNQGGREAAAVADEPSMGATDRVYQRLVVIHYSRIVDG